MSVRSSLTAIALYLLTLTFANAAPQINQMAPDFTLQAANGDMVKLSEHRGKYVVLEWTNHLCPFVKKHYDSGNMQALQKQYTDQGVVWLSVISSAEGKQGFVDSDGANQLTSGRGATPSHVLLDASGEVGKMYDAKTTPHMYIITPEGNLAYMGAIDSIKSASPADIPKATNYVQVAMNELMNGKAVSNPKTKPYGCSVKY